MWTAARTITMRSGGLWSRGRLRCHRNGLRPGRGCTRAQLVTFLWRANGSPEPSEKENPFTDVSPDSYYYKAVLWAVEQGITSGVTKTAFAPDRVCTRAQAAVLLWRAEGSPAASGTHDFRDVAEGAYYADAVAWAVESGVTQGTTSTTFEPARPALGADHDLPPPRHGVTERAPGQMQAGPAESPGQDAAHVKRRPRGDSPCGPPLCLSRNLKK